MGRAWAGGGNAWAYYATRGPARPLAWQWNQAYYWATMSALGNYMVPEGSAQTSFSTMGCLVGIFMTATITGSITSLLANADVVAQHTTARTTHDRTVDRRPPGPPTPRCTRPVHPPPHAHAQHPPIQ